MKNFDHFNLISPIYDKVFGRSEDLRIVELAEVKENHRILDVGGGTGRVSALFSKISNFIVIADSAFEMLGKAQEKGLICVNSHSENLPYPGEVFDRVIMVDALHHVGNQQKSLDEMFRVLKCGGKMIIEEPDIRHFMVKMIALGEKILLMRSHFLTPTEIVSMCWFDGRATHEVYLEKGIARIIITKIN